MAEPEPSEAPTVRLPLILLLILLGEVVLLGLLLGGVLLSIGLGVARHAGL